jgi:predicted alpha/beta-hydrolase family hydrolase
MAARRHGERRGPDPARHLCAHLLAVAARFAPPDRLVLAGKSMGGRIATMVADELAVAGVGALGYPFHPPRQPTRLRTAHLATLRTPCLILQGERDPFGTRTEVEGYALSPAITVHWLPDGDHSFGARQKSGHSTAANVADAIARLASFAHECGGRR